MGRVSDAGIQFGKPDNIGCESRVPVGTMRIECNRPATFIYGPECEAETGKLMYLCDEHAQFIKDWAAKNAENPVECPTHGRIGKVKDYLILKEM